MKEKYSVSAVKTWKTDDGGGYQGNLHQSGKKVGFFHQDGNGGETTIRFDKKEDEKEFNEFIDSLPLETWPEEWGGGNTRFPERHLSGVLLTITKMKSG